MCEGEMKTIIRFLKDYADDLEQNYTEEINICEICLIHIETIVKLLRQYKEEEKAPID